MNDEVNLSTPPPPSHLHYGDNACLPYRSVVRVTSHGQHLEHQRLVIHVNYSYFYKYDEKCGETRKKNSSYIVLELGNRSMKLVKADQRQFLYAVNVPSSCLRAESPWLRNSFTGRVVNTCLEDRSTSDWNS